MRGNGGPLALAILLVLVPLTGCVGTGPIGTVASGDQHDAANDLAAEALPGGSLAGIFGIETAREGISDDGEFRFRTHLDATPGDGQAPLWAFGYRNDDGSEAYGVALAPTIGPLAEVWVQDEEDEVNDLEPLGQWSLTSEDVAQVLDDEPDWPARQANLTYMWTLVNESDDDRGPVWYVFVIEGLWFGDQAFAAVDANTGEVLELDRSDGEEEFVAGGCARSGASGPIAAGQAGPMGTLEVLEPGVLTYEVSLENTIGEIRFLVESEDGEVVVDMTFGTGETGVGETTVPIDEGTYDHSLSADGTPPGAATDSRVALEAMWGARSFCAPSPGDGGAQGMAAAVLG